MNGHALQGFTRSEYWRKTAVRTLLVFVLIGIVVNPSFYIFHRMTRDTVSTSIQEEEMLQVAYTAEEIVASFQSIWGDTLYLSSSEILRYYLNGSADRESVASNFLTFARSRRIYDQIQFLDMKGNEVVRINHHQGYYTAVEDDALQNKIHRYYFQESARLERGEMYLSRLDLNVENEEIELPYKPMIRVGTSVFDENGRKRGVVVLNLLGSRVLNKLNTLIDHPTREVMLVNGNGYWLKGPDPEKEWGFMFAEKNRTGFAWNHSEAWQRMVFEPRGQFFLEDGLYTFAEIDPRVSFGDRTSIPPETIHKPGGSYPMKLISFYPRDEYRNLLWERAEGLLLGYFVSLIVAFVFSVIIARFLVVQMQARRMIEHMALHDTLTGLPARRLFYDRLETALKSARRNRQRLAVLFLDLDSFKELNDSAGHEAGDILLAEVAQRLLGCLRESDTVARLGGDEFVVLLENIESREDFRLVAEKIMSAVRQPCEIQGREVSVNVSIGAAIAPDEAETVDEIIRIADEEMYKVKKAGKDRFK
ncbi:sensor domain-containing diguanylate cyclase [Marispirochaeta sp.]|uniref:sensor domain-containing diguanylate cyclase n=1 Tax=Marispirochaeta sp. TaxID=2038653 RepID=UPI0029C60093|nr:sensor domain-containing diguanylate cyclase [Marispirochaeta sp.]